MQLDPEHVVRFGIRWPATRSPWGHLTLDPDRRPVWDDDPQLFVPTPDWQALLVDRFGSITRGVYHTLNDPQ